MCTGLKILDDYDENVLGGKLVRAYLNKWDFRDLYVAGMKPTAVLVCKWQQGNIVNNVDKQKKQASLQFGES